MARNRFQKTNPLANLPIRWKLMLVFGVIGFLLLAQTILSFNSINTLENSFALSNKQGEIKEVSLNIESLQRLEESLVNDWTIDSQKNTRNNYHIATNFSNQLYTDLQTKIADLEQLNPPPTINISDGKNIINNLLTNRNSITAIANQSIFQSPSLGLINNLENLVYIYRDTKGDMLSTLGLMIGTGNSSLQSLLVTELRIKLTSLLPAMDDENSIIGDPDQSFLIDENIGLNINHTLYLEFLNIIQNLRFINANFITQINSVSSQFENADYSLRNMDNSSYSNFQETMNNINENANSSTLLLDGFLSRLAGLRNTLKTSLAIYRDQVAELSDWIFQLNNWATQGQAILETDFIQAVNIQQSVVFIVLLFATILFFVLVSQINSQVAKPIKSLTYWSELISEGDLSKTHRIQDRDDEVGQLQQNFKEMNVNLREIISQVQESADLISHTSEDLASSTQEINATAEEVSAIAQTMAKGSTEQAEIITTIVQELQQATDVVDNVVTQITGNLAIIKDLSEQTNILALNTAIEAANAGEYARGFQVIAENIRKMSDQSRRTSQRVSRESREILVQLQDSFNHISEMIENVASVSEETAASAEEVAASAEEMTASMQNIAASSSVLSEKSIESLEKVNQFKLE